MRDSLYKTRGKCRALVAIVATRRQKNVRASRAAGDVFQQLAGIKRSPSLAAPASSGWRCSLDDGRVVTRDMTLRPFRATAMRLDALANALQRVVVSSRTVALPCFAQLSLSADRPRLVASVFRRRHNMTGNRNFGGGCRNKTRPIRRPCQLSFAASSVSSRDPRSKCRPGLVVPKVDRAGYRRGRGGDLVHFEARRDFRRNVARINLDASMINKSLYEIEVERSRKVRRRSEGRGSIGSTLGTAHTFVLSLNRHASETHWPPGSSVCRFGGRSQETYSTEKMKVSSSRQNRVSGDSRRRSR